MRQQLYSMFTDVLQSLADLDELTNFLFDF